jgi:spermidine synthase
LAPGGVFVNQAGSLSPVLIDPLARTVRTIASAFPYGVVMTVNVPTYGSPWGLTMARETRIDPFPIAARTDMLLSKAVNGPLRMFDGQSFLGMMQPAKYVRERINAEKFVYTLESPPGLARS